jgi:hypothetical protein
MKVKPSSKFQVMQMAMQLEALAKLAELWSWEWIATLSFWGPISRSRANRRYDQWIEAVKRKIGGRKFCWVRVTYRTSPDSIHFLVLVGGLVDGDRHGWGELWGGKSQISLFDRGQHRIRNIFKKLSKESLDIDCHFPKDDREADVV